MSRTNEAVGRVSEFLRQWAMGMVTGQYGDHIYGLNRDKTHLDAAVLLATDLEIILDALTAANKRADESALRSIEARNPGIDMTEVKRAYERARADQ